MHAADTPQLTGLAGQIPMGATVIAVTDAGDDERYAPVRSMAGRLAGEVGGRVVLCHTGDGEQTGGARRPRLFFPPLDDEAGGRLHTGSRVRDLLLAEARGIAAAGIVVAVWLPREPGPTGIAEAVRATGAVVVLVRSRSARPAIIDRTLDHHASRIPVPVVAVGPDGACTLVRPLGSGAPAAHPMEPARSRGGTLVTAGH